MADPKHPRHYDEIARGVHYREDVPVRDLFETDLDHMLPLPPSMFDACDWRGVKADRTGNGHDRLEPLPNLL